MEAFMCDEDPDQGVDDEYKHKNNPVFCWRFTRFVSYLDQDSIKIKYKNDTGNGSDVTEIVNTIAKKGTEQPTPE